jgi:hypothetical protein
MPTATGIVRLDFDKKGLLGMKDGIFQVNNSIAGMNKQFAATGNQMDMLRQKTSGLKREISAFRNDVLLVMFSMAGVAREFSKSIEASVKFQVALTGVRSVALATGNDLSGVKQATTELTKDGLLSLSGAAQGLKNLLATGLNLEQAVNLMKVFKNAAAFNRQGVLEFEEAIVRATAGVKMQNIRLIDDVGIRTRIAQMMKRQGYELEDLTNETTKAAAVQALYSGLVNEGRYFTGDAARLTQTYAGAQAALEAQLLKTRAAFGDILTGASGNVGVMGILAEAADRYLRYLQLMIEGHKSLITAKVQIYFQQIRDILSGVWMVISPIIGAFATLGNVLGSSVIAKFAIWGLLLGKTITKVARLSTELLGLGKAGEMSSRLNSTWSVARLGPATQPFLNSMTRTGIVGQIEMQEFQKNFTKNILQSGAKTAMLQTSAGMMNVPLGYYTKQATDMAANIEKSFAGLSVGSLKTVQKQFADFGKNIGLSAAQMNQYFPGITQNFKTLGLLTNFTQKGASGIATALKSLAGAAGYAASRIGSMVLGFIKANAAMLIMQAAVIGIIMYLDAQANKEAFLKEIQENREESLRKMIQGEKDAYDSKKAEISNVGQLLEEYKGLAENTDKNEASLKRMTTIETKVIQVFDKYGIALNNKINLHTNYNEVLQKSIDLEEEQAKKDLERQKAMLETAKYQKATSVGQSLTEGSGLKEIYETVVKTEIKEVQDALKDVIQTQSVAGSAGGFGFGALGLTGLASAKAVGLGEGSATEIGTKMLSIYDLSVKRIEEYNKVLAKLGAENVKSAVTGAFVEKSVQAQAEAVNRGIEAWIRLQAVLVKNGITSKEFAEELEKVNKVLNETTDAGNAKRFENFLITLRGAYAKTLVVGDFANKIIEVQTAIARFKSDQKFYTSQGMDKGKTDEAVKLIKLIERNSINKILNEATGGARKLTNEIGLANKQLFQTPEQAAATEVEEKRIGMLEKILQERESLESAKISIRLSLRDMEMADSAVRGTDEWKNKYASLSKYIYQIDRYIDGLDKSNDVLEENIRIGMRRAIVEARIKRLEQIGTITSGTQKHYIESKQQLDILYASADQQDIINARVSHENELRELQAKRVKAVEEREKALNNRDLELGNAWNRQIVAMDIAYGIAQQIFLVTQDRLFAEKALERIIKNQNLETNKALSKGNLKGAMYDIGSFGTGILGDTRRYNDSIEQADRKLQLVKDKWGETSQEFTDAQLTYQQTVLDSNEKILDSYANLFTSIAKYAEDTFDIFGLKSYEANLKTKQDLRVNQALLDDQYAHNEISAEEYAAKRTMYSKKATLEEVKNRQIQAAEEKIAIGNTLKSLAMEYAVRALASTALGFLGYPEGFEAAAAYSSAAALAGGVGIALMKSGLAQKAQAEADFNLNSTLAERQADRTSSKSSTDTSGKSIGGTITAQELHIYISPTTTIQGETIIISNIGIEEAKQILADATVQRIQEAIDNRELQLANVAS